MNGVKRHKPAKEAVMDRVKRHIPAKEAVMDGVEGAVAEVYQSFRLRPLQTDTSTMD